MKPQEGETFVDWFARNKAVFEQQNPELTPSELTRLGVKTFKTIQTKAPIENGNKRKLDDETNGTDPPVSSAPKQSKLSAFSFQKKV